MMRDTGSSGSREASEADPAARGAAGSDAPATPAAPLTVISLCAAWCDTCDVFRTTLGRVAAARPQVAFVWLDIEDDSALCGDVDVENFPTLAICRGDALLHYGVSLPQAEVVGRLIDAMARDDVPPVTGPPAVHAMLAALRRR